MPSPGEEEHGIPGHAGKTGPARLLQHALKELGVSFEAEGETTRIHLAGTIIEVKEDPDLGRITQVSAPLPAPGDDPEDATKPLRVLAVLVTFLRGEPRYVAEEAAPGYYTLHAMIPYQDPYQQAEDLLEAVRRIITLEGYESL